MSDIFKRLIQFIENQGYKNINDFCTNGLGWASSEKIHRLKKENNKPSVDLMIEIYNKFNNFNIHWILTGTNEFDEKPVDFGRNSEVNEPALGYGKVKKMVSFEKNEEKKDALEKLNAQLIESQTRTIQVLERQVSMLEEQLHECRQANERQIG